MHHSRHIIRSSKSISRRFAVTLLNLNEFQSVGILPCAITYGDFEALGEILTPLNNRWIEGKHRQLLINTVKEQYPQLANLNVSHLTIWNLNEWLDSISDEWLPLTPIPG